MADVFLSYKREDRENVRKLARALQARGFTVWWDNRLEWSGQWDRCIKRALDASKTAIVVWTPASVAPDGTYTSDIVAEEANRKAGSHDLKPVRIGGVKQRPFPHSGLQEIDLTAWADGGDDAAIERVFAYLERESGARLPPDATELAAWFSAENANHPTAFRGFAVAFPDSRFTAEVERRAAETEIRAAHIGLGREIGSEITKSFAEEVNKPDFTPPLPLEIMTKDGPAGFARNELFALLQDGGRAVMEADPGGGKTTALLDLAQSYNQSSDEAVGVFLRLKPLAIHGGGLMAF
jgi:hypothetical protein